MLAPVGSAAPAAYADAPVTMYVSTTGHAGAAGTAADPLATLAEAWGRIPRGSTLAAPVTIRMAPGSYPESALPEYMEDRHGSALAPITITSDGAARSAVLGGDLNIFNVDYLRLDGLTINPRGDVVHCERCGNVTITESILDGHGSAHETFKANQSHDLTITRNEIRGSYENAIDYVAVQHSLIERNIISDAEDWCAYAKGGSTDVTVRYNEIRNCGTGGFSAGQGSGLEYLVAPWLTYEATDMHIEENFIHDTEGAAFGVNGGQNITFSGNAATHVGTRSHLVEVTFGGRTCDGDTAACHARLLQGAWGTDIVGGDGANIPDQNVTISNNTIVNPAGVQSQWQHLEVSTPRSNTAPVVGPSPALTDDGLRITGNVVRNGGPDMPLGVEGVSVCAPANPTCTVAQLLRDNDFNGAAPVSVPTAVPGGIVPGPTPIADAGAVFVPVDPARVFDSRSAVVGAGALARGEVRSVYVGNEMGAGGRRDVVPAGAIAIAYNLTVPSGTSSGHLRVMPGSASSAPASAINFGPGAAIANGLVVKLGAVAGGGDGRWIKLDNRASGRVDAVVDVVGYFLPAADATDVQRGAGRFTAIAPVRVYDSVADHGSPGGLLAGQQTRTVSVANQIPAAGGARDVVPAGAAAIAYNITVVSPTGSGHLRVFPGDVNSSEASTINWGARDTVANGISVRIAADRTIRVFNGTHSPVRFLIDVAGYYGGSGALFHPIDPVRAYDSRVPQPLPGMLPTSGLAQVDRTIGVADARDPVSGAVVAADAVPIGAVAVAYNLTVTGGTGGGHLRLYPASAARPEASSLNWPAANPAVARANGSVVGISPIRQVKLFNSSSAGTHAVIDTLGYYQ